jgi:hypothetical protein
MSSQITTSFNHCHFLYGEVSAKGSEGSSTETRPLVRLSQWQIRGLMAKINRRGSKDIWTASIQTSDSWWKQKKIAYCHFSTSRSRGGQRFTSSSVVSFSRHSSDGQGHLWPRKYRNPVSGEHFQAEWVQYKEHSQRHEPRKVVIFTGG